MEWDFKGAKLSTMVINIQHNFLLIYTIKKRPKGPVVLIKTDMPKTSNTCIDNYHTASLMHEVCLSYNGGLQHVLTCSEYESSSGILKWWNYFNFIT